MDLKVEIKLQIRDQNMEIELSGPSMGVLIGKKRANT